jgi:hypothetical protein
MRVSSVIKMKTVVRKFNYALVACCLAASAPLSAEPPWLPADLKLRIQVQQLTEQVHALQVQLAQCRANSADVQARLDSVQLSALGSEIRLKHDALDAEIKKALGGGDADIVDWTTNPPSLKKKPAHDGR